MAIGNPDAALEYLRRILGLIEQIHGLAESRGDGYWDLPDWKDLDAKILAALPGALRIAYEADPAAHGMMQSPDGQWFPKWTNAREGAVRAIGAIESDAEVAAALAPVGPRLLAGDLHHVVWASAAELWDQGHRRLALQTAATMVDSHLKAKLDVVKPSDYELVTQAFTPKPKPGAKVLRFTQYLAGSEDWNSAHQGAMAFGQGCMLAIRNLSTHRPVEPGSQLALEQLAALSVLARWIDEAEVVVAE